MPVERRPRIYAPPPRADAIAQISAAVIEAIGPALVVSAEAIADNGGTLDDLRNAINAALDDLEAP